MTVEQGAEPGAASVADRVQATRGELLGGRGTGADDAEIAALTRNRASIAGVDSTRRLQLVARQTARARGDDAAIADDIEQARGELVHTVGVLADRLSPARIVQRGRVGMGEVVARHPAAVIVGAMVVGILLAVWFRPGSATRTG